MQRPLAILLFAAACTEPGLSSSSSPIIGGTLVTAGEFPTVVALEQGPGQWFCTGTLIDKSWVLSAAHCVEGAPQGAVKIRIDDLDVNNTTGGMEVGTTEHHANPAWDQNGWGGDLALLKLAQPIDRPVTPIHRTKITFDSPVLQVGYGVTNDQGAGGGVLRKLSEHNKDCAMTGDATISNDKVLCFDPIDGGGCYGDSGGPTFFDVGGGKLEVVGVTSGGTGQACTDSWGIWTLVPAELAWIDGIMMAQPPMPDPMPQPDPQPMPDDDDSDGGGCSTGGGAGLGLAFALAALVRRRRR
jgi:secreted trypsin-like serine protease